MAHSDLPKVHPELQAFFDTHRAATKEHANTMHAEIDAIVEVSAAVQGHVMTLLAQLEKAERAAHAKGLDPKMEYMHGRLRRARDLAVGFHQAARDLVTILHSMSSAFDQDEIDAKALFDARLDGLPVDEPATPAVVPAATDP